MGPTHAVSSATFWLYAYPVVQAWAGRPFTVAEILTGAALTAGAGLIADIDEPHSTIARSLGPLTAGAAHILDAVSVLVHNATLGPRDEPAVNGHRLLTHTLVVTLAAGLAVLAGGRHIGRPFVLPLLFVLLGLAVRGLLGAWIARNGWVAAFCAAGGGTALAYAALPDVSFGYLAATVVMGGVGHLLGDMHTRDRAPVLWPLMIRGKRWFVLGMPSWLTFRAGGAFEKGLVLPGFTLAAGFGLLRVIDPSTANAIQDTALTTVMNVVRS